MQFGQPLFLFGLILVPVMATFLIFANRSRQAAITRLGNPALVNRLSQTVNRRGRIWRMVLWFFVLELIVFALARPQWGSEVQQVQQQGIEIMLALDVSQSMLAEDVKPDRLSRAKLEIASMLERLEGNEVGLVLFSGASFIQFPLTSDFATARTFLENANPTMISRPGIAIEGAIRTALSGFNPQRASQKVIVIFTDGEALEGDALLAAQEAREAGVVIFTVGLGSPDGVPIPEYNNQGVPIGYKKDRAGNTVLSRLDEAGLQQIAAATNGRYYRASAGGQEIGALVGSLDALQKAELESRFEVLHVERFQWFLGAALLALIVIELIPDRRLRSPVA